MLKLSVLHGAVLLLASLLSRQTVAVTPKIFIYSLPKDLEAKYLKAVFGSDRHFAMLRTIKTTCSTESEVCQLVENGSQADYYWVPGLGKEVIEWVRTAHPWWNETVAKGQARHLMMTTHDLGAAEMYWRLEQGHAGKLDPEYDPISKNRSICYLQYHGMADGEQERKSCGVCFQPGRDIMLMKGEGVCGPMCGFSLEDLRKSAVWGSQGKWENGSSTSDIEKRRERLLYFTGTAGKNPNPQVLFISKVTTNHNHQPTSLLPPGA